MLPRCCGAIATNCEFVTGQRVEPSAMLKRLISGGMPRAFLRAPMTLAVAVLLAFGAGLVVRPFVDGDRRHDWSYDLEERCGSFTRDQDYD
jgi:hypothetical protein